MYSGTKLNGSKYSIDEKIISILKRAPQRGIWMKALAEKVGISRPLLNYYLFGLKKRGKLTGGRFRNDILIRKEGNNHFVKLIVSKAEIERM